MNGASEVLAANTAGTSITANYDSGTGILTLSGADTVANYQQVLEDSDLQQRLAEPQHHRPGDRVYRQ